MSIGASGHRILPSEAVVERVANREGVDPVELSPLYEAIDPDALDSLVCASNGDGSDLAIEFSYSGHEITVTGEGVVHLDQAVASQTIA